LASASSTRAAPRGRPWDGARAPRSAGASRPAQESGHLSGPFSSRSSRRHRPPRVRRSRPDRRSRPAPASRPPRTPWRPATTTGSPAATLPRTSGRGYPWPRASRWAAPTETGPPPSAPGTASRGHRGARWPQRSRDQSLRRRQGLGPDHDRKATAERHAERVADRGQEAERGPVSQRAARGHDRCRHGLRGDGAHDPVGEAGRGLQATAPRHSLEVSRDASFGGELLGTDPRDAVQLVGGERTRTPVRPVAGHRSASSSARRRRARPRWRCVFTVPSGRSVASAISASERSAKKRRATTSR
jgi:hypothetical protein